MVDLLTVDMVDDLTAGAAFLGTGGGGDPYLGGLLCREALDRYGPVELLALGNVPDDAAVFTAAAMGAPTVLIEKLLSLDDADCAVRALERHLGRTATAIIPAEIGGINATLPIAYAAMRRLPVIDADGMGRAFPSLHMTTFNVAGVACSPLSLADENGDYAIIEAASARRAEDLARPFVTAMGASATLSCYPMQGFEVRRAAVGGSLSAALAIGAALHARSDDHPVSRLMACLDAHPLYGGARRLFDGKIVGLQRDTSRGWVFGRCDLESLDGTSVAEVSFQNENLAIRVGGTLRAIVPDLITIVDRETGLTIPTESLRYGQRVCVVGCCAPAALRSPEALGYMGPASFDLPDTYRIIDDLTP